MPWCGKSVVVLQCSAGVTNAFRRHAILRSIFEANVCAESETLKFHVFSHFLKTSSVSHSMLPNFYYTNIRRKEYSSTVQGTVRARSGSVCLLVSCKRPLFLNTSRWSMSGTGRLRRRPYARWGCPRFICRVVTTLRDRL